MRRMTCIVMALAVVLGLAQCKKEQPLEPQGEQVRITLNVDNGASTGSASDGSKVIVNPNSSPMVTFENGDKILVGSGGKYVGTLTHNGEHFAGSITDPTEGQPLYFYFLGNKDAGTLAAGTSTTCSVNISDQTSNLPVISMAPSTVSYSSSVNSYSAALHNKCAMVKFNVTTPSTSPICITGMNNKVTVNFDPTTAETDEGFSFSVDAVDGGLIKMAGKNASDETWAIALPQAAMAAGAEGTAYTNTEEQRYKGSRPALEAIVKNTYINAGVDMAVNTDDNSTTVDLSRIVYKYKVKDGETLTGTLVGNHEIIIADNATVTLSNVTINSTEHAAISCLGSATVILEDGTTNTLTTGARYNAALHAGPDNTTLTIQGNTGKLTATATALYSAGIGGGYNYYSHKCGNITIEGGIIEASGRTGGAGIGSSDWSTCGTITITGGNVTATGGWDAAGIGGGAFYYCATFEGIIISGGTVTATGGNGAAGIGNGCDDKDAGHNVTITNGITKVIARKGGTEAGDVNAFPIGPGHDAQVGNVVFGGYTVFDGTSWSPDPMVTGKYGDLWLDISGGTWTLTPFEGKFTVNGSGKQVVFAPGVLQYKDDESYKWRFAENQWDRNNNLVGTWFDHFGWGTWTGSSPNPTYFNTPSYQYQYTWNNSDFSKESNLVNEDLRSYNWYTLSSDEWQYLFANHIYGAAEVHDVNGVIVLPDGMTSATGFTPGMGSWNTVSDDDWEAMEHCGALFLPVAGYRDLTDFYNLNEGYYWASGTGAYYVQFGSGSVNAGASDLNHRYYGRLVRLVRNVN